MAVIVANEFSNAAYRALESTLINGMSGAQNPTQSFMAAVPPLNPAPRQEVMSYSDIEPEWYEKRLPMEGRATFLPFQNTMEGSVFNERKLAVPGVLAELMNAFTAPARSMTDPTFNAGEEAAGMAMNVGGSGLAISRGMRSPTGQGGFDLAMNAYHGTPYEIKGGFDLSKVGTGEGAQSYGYGTYFAKDPNVAKTYTTAGTSVTAPDRATEFIIRAKESTSSDSSAKQFLQNRLDSATDDVKPFLQEALQKFDSFKAGNLYKVDIPDDQIPKMLDWDKPLAKQNKKVLDILKNEPAILADLANGRSLDKLTGRQAYQAIASTFDVGEKEAYKLASNYLNSKGIPGIRYLDSLSRGSGKGTQNFVSFDPTTVKILEKNDIPVNKSLNSITDDLNSQGIKFDVSENKGTINLSRIVVPKEQRSQGIGSSAMDKLLDYADSTGQRVALTPSSDFGGSVPKLKEFYKKFGFVENKGKNKDFTTRETMIRPAKK